MKKFILIAITLGIVSGSGIQGQEVQTQQPQQPQPQEQQAQSQEPPTFTSESKDIGKTVLKETAKATFLDAFGVRPPPPPFPFGQPPPFGMLPGPPPPFGPPPFGMPPGPPPPFGPPPFAPPPFGQPPGQAQQPIGMPPQQQPIGMPPQQQPLYGTSPPPGQPQNVMPPQSYPAATVNNTPTTPPANTMQYNNSAAPTANAAVQPMATTCNNGVTKFDPQQLQELANALTNVLVPKQVNHAFMQDHTGALINYNHMDADSAIHPAATNSYYHQPSYSYNRPTYNNCVQNRLRHRRFPDYSMGLDF